MIRIRQIKIDVIKYTDELLKEKIENILNKKIISYKINKKSIDARNKDSINYVFEVDVEVEDEDNVLKNNKNENIIKTPNLEYKLPLNRLNKSKKIYIIGAGPAGLFAAYNLAIAGYQVNIIERGNCVEKRIDDVNNFFKTGVLNKSSNVQFGEGGAGTFSDGKLNTLKKDDCNRGRYVLSIFNKFGAHDDILYEHMPHIGTDILINVVKNMRRYLESLGVKYYFDSCLTDIEIENNHIKSITINDKEKYESDILILAIGHSARDTFKMIHDKGIILNNKPFAVGIRIIHDEASISECQYGKKYMKYLPPATYKLTTNTSNNRGVYSFCMCPGGYVINASSEENKLVINGMSNNKRDSGFSNSAIIATVDEKVYGNNLFDGMRFQEELEEKAYNAANGLIPIQLYKDYKDEKISSDFGTIKPEFMGNYKFSDINKILPKEINDSIKEALITFSKKIKCFGDEDAVIAGVETRTSSPIRINRDSLFETNIKGVLPIGEGAGYAGGITTSAIDGIKVSEIIMNNEL